MATQPPDSTTDSINTSRVQTQTQRRVTFGVNVLIVIAVAIAITGLVNYIGYAYLFKYRKDLTATGEYSLSPQTRKVIASAEQPVKIISLFGGSQNAQIQTRIDKARGLVEEYGFVTPKVTVQHIDPLREPARLDAFYSSIRERYQDRLSPLDNAVKEGLVGVEQMQQQMKAQVVSLTEILGRNDMPQGKLPETLQAVSRVISQQEADFGQYLSQIQKAMDRPLADYGGAVATLSTLMQTIDERLFAQAVKLIDPFARNPRTPDDIKNELLKLLDQFSASRRQISPLLETLQAAAPLPEYDQLYVQLANANVVVLVGEKEVDVVTLDQMFKAADAQQEIREPQFLGEEKITGALLGMQQKLMPMVVFVSNPQLPALGQRGMFRAMGQRLENSRFRVEEWSPQGRPGPMGQMMPAAEPPKPDPGQRVVWIVLPMMPANPMMPMQTGGAERVITLLHERAMVGDGAMLILSYDQGGAVGVPDPMTLWAQQWGIIAQNDRMILREQLLADRRTAAQGVMAISQWPQQLAITRALSGFTAVFAASSPLILADAQSQPAGEGGLQIFPLAVVQGEGLWTEREPQATSKYKPESAAKQFTIAAAAQKGDSRLVVVADPVWATDQLSTNPAFPGNAELFVNSVYWLSGLEDMIAASARTQDIRRVGEISPNGMLMLRWAMMLGMPLLVASAGMGVWLVRRRG